MPIPLIFSSHFEAFTGLLWNEHYPKQIHSSFVLLPVMLDDSLRLIVSRFDAYVCIKAFLSFPQNGPRKLNYAKRY